MSALDLLESDLQSSFITLFPVIVGKDFAGPFSFPFQGIEFFSFHNSSFHLAKGMVFL